MSSTRCPVAPSRRGQQHLELGFGEEVLDDRERHVLAALGADREVAHRFAVAHQREIDQLAAGIAGAQIDELRPLVGGNGVAELLVDRRRLVVAAALERIDAVEKTRCRFHGLFCPQRKKVTSVVSTRAMATRAADASGPTESHRRQYSKQEACQTAAGKRNGAFCNGMTPN